MKDINLIECLKYIDPACVTYTEWVNVGMALKHEGYTVSDWEEWSKSDSRFHVGECEKKWETFVGSASPVTAGTIVQMAKKNGWSAYNDESYALDWDSTIGGKSELKIIDKSWLEGTDIVIPEHWEPAKQIITYINTLFEAAEIVGYVTECWQNNDGKYLPSKGSYTLTAGEIVEKLNKYGDDIGAALGDYKVEAGAWIRFNPLDGKGVRNDNVTDYRYALVESDTMDIAQQNTILRQLELPIACLVYSGGKSLHAIVKIEASGFEEYRKRVEFLYEVCKKNGLEIDRQNKNPSRLSRMPGVERNGQKQYLLDTNIGKQSWNEWKDWIESVTDELPDPESMADVWDSLPELSPPLIHGVLRQGHKMLLAGSSKAGKSFALIELCCSIAEGRPWLGFECAQGRVMYVNLELDRASCLHRFRDVYTALGWMPENVKNIDIWNLRGKSIPMDKLAPKLIRRAAKKGYIAIIIDPIYKIITGDENSADQMAYFCNQFDKVCTELGCAVIYCHHHSKGAQGGKNSMDRASGSGVFARDPDALLDLIELPATDAMKEEKGDADIADMCMKWLARFGKDNVPTQEDKSDFRKMLEICRAELPASIHDVIAQELTAIRAKAEKQTAWRIEGTLREFPRFDPVNLWFNFPIHTIDPKGSLKDVKPDSGYTLRGAPYEENFKNKKTKEERQDDRKKALEVAFEAVQIDGKTTVKALREYLGVKTEETVRNYLSEHGGFWREEGIVGRKA